MSEDEVDRKWIWEDSLVLSMRLVAVIVTEGCAVAATGLGETDKVAEGQVDCIHPFAEEFVEHAARVLGVQVADRGHQPQ